MLIYNDKVSWLGIAEQNAAKILSVENVRTNRLKFLVETYTARLSAGMSPARIRDILGWPRRADQR